MRKPMVTMVVLLVASMMLLGRGPMAWGAEGNGARPALDSVQLETMMVAEGLQFEKVRENVYRLSFNGSLRPWVVYLGIQAENLRIATQLIRVPAAEQQISHVLLKVLEDPRKFSDLKIYLDNNVVWAAKDMPPALVDAPLLKRHIHTLLGWGERTYPELVRAATP
jgi:hypothetical protein